MKKFAGSLLISFLLLAGLITAAAAQEMSEKMMGPPRVLLIYREFLKPGKMGSSHEKTESLFVQAYARAKWPTHYFAADSLSGKPRSLFFVGYDSFAAYEKDFLAIQKNATLSAALDRAGVADGELQSDADAGTFVFNERYSQSPPGDIAHMRYFDIEVFHVKPGHHHEWDEAVKLVKAAYEKIPDVHWAVFEQVYGGDTGTYVVFTPMKSLAEVDTSFAQGKQFQENMGAEGMKKLSELEHAAFASAASHQLFQFNPRMSYPPDAWVAADPDFWKPKMAGPPAAKKSDKEPAKH